MIVLKALGLFPSIDGLELLIFIYFVASMFQQFMVQTAKGLDYVQDMGAAGALGTFATILGCILCLLVFDMGLKGFYIANISGQIVPAVYIGIRVKIWKYCGFGITERRIRLVHKEMLIYCVPLLLNTLGWHVNNYFDKYVVVVMMGEAANGLLGVAYKIPTILVTLQSIFNQAWQISAVKGYQDNNRSELYCNIFAMMNLVMSLSCSSLIFIIKILAKILFAKDFFAAWEFVPILLVSSVVNASAGVLGAILGAQKNSRAMAIAGFAGIVVNIVLNILLVDKMGVQGAVIATLISSLVIYAVRQISVKSFFNKEIVLKALISWGLLVVQSIVASRLQTSIGYLIQVLLIAMLVVCNWRYTKKIFNMGLKIIFKKEKP
jgi:O-antigen/teichoic acid export membrane protein